MAHRNESDSDYDLLEELENLSEFEDEPSEHELEMSDDEFDDQGHDDYDHYPDYIEIEEEPLHARASRNVQTRTTETSSDQQQGPSTAPQPVDNQGDDQHNTAYIGQQLQFEDASSPEKQGTPQRPAFSLRSLRKRSYQDVGTDSGDSDSQPPQRRPAGRGSQRISASLILDAPSSSGSDADFVPETTPRRGRGVGRPPSRPRGRGRG